MALYVGASFVAELVLMENLMTMHFRCIACS